MAHRRFTSRLLSAPYLQCPYRKHRTLPERLVIWDGPWTPIRRTSGRPKTGGETRNNRHTQTHPIHALAVFWSPLAQEKRPEQQAAGR